MAISKNRKASSQLDVCHVKTVEDQHQKPHARVSAEMRFIRKRDTKPEIVVRSLVHRTGYRYRLHRSDLPGTPDLVFPSRKKVILVHGCFWHQHNCHLGCRQPKVNSAYWLPKLKRNQERDIATEDALTRAGWDVLIIWECETRYADGIEAKVRSFLERGICIQAIER